PSSGGRLPGADERRPPCARRVTQLGAERLAHPSVAPLASRAEAARARRHQILQQALERGAAIAAVAGERLIAALARQDHFELPGRVLGKEGRWQGGVILQQVVRGPYGVRQAS